MCFSSSGVPLGVGQPCGIGCAVRGLPTRAPFRFAPMGLHPIPRAHCGRGLANHFWLVLCFHAAPPVWLSAGLPLLGSEFPALGFGERGSVERVAGFDGLGGLATFRRV